MVTETGTDGLVLSTGGQGEIREISWQPLPGQINEGGSSGAVKGEEAEIQGFGAAGRKRRLWTHEEEPDQSSAAALDKQTAIAGRLRLEELEPRRNHLLGSPQRQSQEQERLMAEL